VWLAEHVVLFDEYESRYPYADNGRFPGGGDTGLLEPLTGLAYLAAVTDTVRLGTAVCLVPQRNPVYTAKQVVDVDVLSGGRVEFGIGIGWLREEFEALGMPFERRAARTREHIEVMKALWTEDVAEYHGELYDLPPCRLYPKPAQQPHPPILVGGESDAALRRVVELGQGWFGFDRAPEDVPEAMVRLEKLLDEHGRDRADISVTVCPYLKPIGDGAMEQYAEAGVDRVVLPVLAFDAARLPEQLDRATVHLERARSL
jgi:probable F420-dependent oxidoreductase